MWVLPWSTTVRRQTLTDAKNAIGLGPEAGHLLPATSSPHATQCPDARWLMHVTCHTAAHHTVALCRTAEPAACYAVAECQAPAAGHLPLDTYRLPRHRGTPDSRRWTPIFPQRPSIITSVGPPKFLWFCQHSPPAGELLMHIRVIRIMCAHSSALLCSVHGASTY